MPKMNPAASLLALAGLAAAAPSLRGQRAASRTKLRKELSRHKWIRVGDFVKLDASTQNQGMALQATKVMLGSTYKVSRIVKDAGYGYIIYARRWNKAQRKFNATPNRFSPGSLVSAEDPRGSSGGQRARSRDQYLSTPADLLREIEAASLVGDVTSAQMLNSDLQAHWSSTPTTRARGNKLVAATLAKSRGGQRAGRGQRDQVSLAQNAWMDTVAEVGRGQLPRGVYGEWLWHSAHSNDGFRIQALSDGRYMLWRAVTGHGRRQDWKAVQVEDSFKSCATIARQLHAADHH